MKSKLTLVVILGAVFALKPLCDSARNTFRFGARHAFAECVFELGRAGVIDLQKAGDWSSVVRYWPGEPPSGEEQEGRTAE
jgi:hypothetical protein